MEWLTKEIKFMDSFGIPIPTEKQSWMNGKQCCNCIRLTKCKDYIALKFPLLIPEFARNWNIKLFVGLNFLKYANHLIIIHIHCELSQPKTLQIKITSS